jgi:hypothetical protein
MSWFLPLTIPALTNSPIPNGLPNANTWSPIRYFVAVVAAAIIFGRLHKPRRIVDGVGNCRASPQHRPAVLHRLLERKVDELSDAIWVVFCRTIIPAPATAQIDVSVGPDLTDLPGKVIELVERVAVSSDIDLVEPSLEVGDRVGAIEPREFEAIGACHR